MRSPDSASSRKLPPVDSCFRALDDNGALQHIAALGILDGIPSSDIVLSKLEELKKRYPRVQNIFKGKSYPKEIRLENFQMQENLYYHHLEVHFSERIQYAINTLMHPFDPLKPLWEVHVFVKNAEPEKTILLYKLHHSLADGMSGLSFFHGLLGHTPNIKKSIGNKFKKTGTTPLWDSLKLLFNEAIHPRPELPHHKKLSKKRKVLLYSFSMAAIKEKKMEFQCTSFSVVLSVISKSLTLYHQKQYGTSFFTNRNSCFRALVPVTLRGNAPVHDLGNAIGGTSLYIPLNIKEDSTLIPMINEALNGILNSKAYDAYHLSAKIFALTPRMIQSRFCAFAAKKLSGICTFLQTPNKTLSLDTATLLHEFAIPALLPEQGISFGFIKYHTTMELSVILDPDCVENVDLLHRCIMEHIGSMKEPELWYPSCNS
jgi:hypothetical protein